MRYQLPSPDRAPAQEAPQWLASLGMCGSAGQCRHGKNPGSSSPNLPGGDRISVRPRVIPFTARGRSAAEPTFCPCAPDCRDPLRRGLQARSIEPCLAAVQVDQPPVRRKPHRVAVLAPDDLALGWGVYSNPALAKCRDSLRRSKWRTGGVGQDVGPRRRKEGEKRRLGWHEIVYRHPHSRAKKPFEAQGSSAEPGRSPSAACP